MDPGETICQAVEREVYEETGVKTKYSGIIGLREILEARYSTTDFYIVCLVTCQEDDRTVQVIDEREIFQAKWIPLSALSSNGEDAPYRMFPNAYKFIKLLHDRVALNPGTTAADLLRQATMTHDELPAAKGKPWAFYISETLRASKL